MNDLIELNIQYSEKQISDLSRKDWKNIVKSKIIKKIEQQVENSDITKMRFIKKGNFGIKEYIKHKKGPTLLKLKLNMTDLKANYKGKYGNISCRRCGLHEENLEHLWRCEKFKRHLPGMEQILKANREIG